MVGPNWRLEDDFEHVILTFPTNPPTEITFTTQQLEDALKNLGIFRSNMKPEIAKTYAVGQVVKAVPNPAWVTEPDLLLGNSLLHIRDPRFGWLHYMIPRDEARKLGSALQKCHLLDPVRARQISIDAFSQGLYYIREMARRKIYVRDVIGHYRKLGLFRSLAHRRHCEIKGDSKENGTDTKNARKEKRREAITRAQYVSLKDSCADRRSRRGT